MATLIKHNTDNTITFSLKFNERSMAYKTLGNNMAYKPLGDNMDNYIDLTHDDFIELGRSTQQKQQELLDDVLRKLGWGSKIKLYIQDDTLVMSYLEGFDMAGHVEIETREMGPFTTGVLNRINPNMVVQAIKLSIRQGIFNGMLTVKDSHEEEIPF